MGHLSSSEHRRQQHHTAGITSTLATVLLWLHWAYREVPMTPLTAPHHHRLVTVGVTSCGDTGPGQGALSPTHGDTAAMVTARESGEHNVYCERSLDISCKYANYFNLVLHREITRSSLVY